VSLAAVVVVLGLGPCLKDSLRTICKSLGLGLEGLGLGLGLEGPGLGLGLEGSRPWPWP